jgi:PAS domain S-box-containing protein
MGPQVLWYNPPHHSAGFADGGFASLDRVTCRDGYAQRNAEEAERATHGRAAGSATGAAGGRSFVLPGSRAVAPSAPGHRLARLAWLPVPVLLAALFALWIADVPGSYEPRFPIIVLNFVFSTLASGLVAYLVARSFLVRGTPGLLLLGCGVVLWGLAGVVASSISDDVNTRIAIHNSCVWLSALCHLAGVLLARRPRRRLSPPALWLPAAYALALAAVVVVTVAALGGWLPTFFVQGQGGTPLRQLVLSSAIAMFVLAGLLLTQASPRPLPPFARWYSLALALIGVGLVGVLFQSSAAGVLSWTGRTAQFLSGVYMLFAAVASARDARAWSISLETALREEQDFSAAVLDTAGALMVVLDTQGRITCFNHTCEQLTGYRAADVLGRVFWTFLIPPEEMAGIAEGWQTLLAGNVPSRHENHWLARDGTRRLIDWSNTALRDKRGEVRRIIAVGIDITERKRAEEALRRSEERERQRAAELATLLEAVPTPVIIVHDPEGVHMTGNRAADELLHHPRGAEISLSAPPAAKPRHFKAVKDGRELRIDELPAQRAARGEPVRDFEFNLVFEDGSIRHMLGYGTPLRDENGRPRGAVHVLVDITDRKRTEEALRRSEEQFRLAVRATQDAIWDLDPASGIVHWSETCAALYGRPPETASSWQWWMDHIHPEDRERAVGGLRAALRGGGSLWTCEYRFQRCDGTWAYLYDRAYIARDAAGRACRVVGAMQDLTARKQAEEELRKSDERFRSVLGSTRDVIACMNLQTGRYEYVSPSAQDLVGYAPKELLAMDRQTALAMVHPDDVPVIQSAQARSEETGRAEAEYRQRARNGDYVWVSNRMSVVKDSSGRPWYRTNSIRDISERKRTEEALRELNVTLEHKVAARTAELEHRARQLQKLTLELTQAEDRERRRIAAVLHEDLQQQIVGAKYHLSRLKRRDRMDPQQETIQTIDEILQTAIAQSRTLSHEMSPPVLRMSDLPRVLEWLAARVRTQYGLLVHLDIPGEAPLQSESLGTFLFRDAQELLFNVVKHAQVHEAVIRVRRIREHVSLSVSDSGRGFDVRQLKQSAGFGLLSIRERVELLGGRMRIRSTRGKGSTFRIVVPDKPLPE